ncbi:MAG: molybdate ABC transporter permease subunit [Campylobacteraceae bacterium]|nr:molybdate ABC transporter permease subunit [Campylobacteraceae bacterium]
MHWWSSIASPLLLSAKTVSASAICLLIFGVPLAYALARREWRLRWVVDVLVTLPLIFPPIAIGFFLLLLLGRNGWIGSYLAKIDISIIFEFSGLVIAGTIAGLPLIVKPLQAAIETFPSSIIEASYISGHGRFVTFFRVILPGVKHALFAALLISTARALGEVGITLMLGGNIIGKTDTISLAIYNAVFDGDHDLALILSLILVIISLLFFAILNFMQKRYSVKGVV